MTNRIECIKGLRMLADLLEAEPKLPVPYGLEPTWSAWGRDTKTEVARIVRLLPGKFTKEVSDDYYRLFGSIGVLKTQVVTYRSSVCEAVTTTETITVKERDPEAVARAMAVIPEYEVAKEITKTEWVCSPLLESAVTS